MSVEEENVGTVVRFVTGQARIDAVLGAAVTIYAASFPGRVRAWYLIGSHAEGKAIATSDVDVEVYFAGAWQDAIEERRAGTLARACQTLAALAAIELDITVGAEADLAAGVSPVLKFGGKLLAGEEMLADLPLVPLPIWTRDRMHTSYWRIVALFGRPRVTTLPLQPPRAADEFYGYLSREVRLATGETVPSTRDLIRSTLWAAAALLAWQAGVYVGRKGDVPRLYAEHAAHVGAEFAPFLAELLAACRDEWGYQVPRASADRARLRALCARTLAFERAFLDRYRVFLLRELTSDEAVGHLAALKPLALAPLLDDAVIEAIRALAVGDRGASPEVSRAAEEVLSGYASGQATLSKW